MLSLVDALLGRPIEDIVRELRLGPDVALALIAREGELGRLLLLAEATESGAFEAAEVELERLGLSLAELQQIEHEAYAWLHALQKSLLG
jgi:EAL and modified HD-GYP domain-containing signal transduction protein